MNRENRYIVIKKSHLTASQLSKLKSYLHLAGVGTVGGVVVESDWPEYEPVWEMIEDRVSPHPGVYWGVEGGNFYDRQTRKGLGRDFYSEYYSRRDQFPTEPFGAGEPVTR